MSVIFISHSNLLVHNLLLSLLQCGHPPGLPDCPGLNLCSMGGITPLNGDASRLTSGGFLLVRFAGFGLVAMSQSS
jgi:hypothetical protein